MTATTVATADVRAHVASLLAALSEREAGDTAAAAACPLATFARSVAALLRHGDYAVDAVARNKNDNNSDTNNNNNNDNDDDDGSSGRCRCAPGAADLSDVLADLSLSLMREEEEMRSVLQLVAVARDKLRGELARMEAQHRDCDTRLRELAVQRRLCKLALSLVVSDDVPHYVDAAATHNAIAAASTTVAVVKNNSNNNNSNNNAHSTRIAFRDDDDKDDDAHTNAAAAIVAADVDVSLPLTSTSAAKTGAAVVATATTTAAVTTATAAVTTAASSASSSSSASSTSSTSLAGLTTSAVTTTAATTSTSLSSTSVDATATTAAMANTATATTGTPAAAVAMTPDRPGDTSATTVVTATSNNNNNNSRTTSPSRSNNNRNNNNRHKDAMARAAANMLAVLHVPDVSEATVLRALATFEQCVFAPCNNNNNSNKTSNNGSSSSSGVATAPLWQCVCSSSIDDEDDDKHDSSNNNSNSSNGDCQRRRRRCAAVLDEVASVLLALLRYLPRPRPPVQLAVLRVLSHVLRATPAPTPHAQQTHMAAATAAAAAAHDDACVTLLGALVHDGHAASTLCKLLSSINDEVKCEALSCLSPLVCLTHALTAAATTTTTNNATTTTTTTTASRARAVCRAARADFLRGGGLAPLVRIVVSSTSEMVLEQALVCLWGMLAKSEHDDAAHNDGVAVRTRVRELGGLRAVLDLLYTDSLVLLEHVSMVIGYATRDDAAKAEMREVGGLEKITATLRHPARSIRAKMAGAVWNCASAAANRTHLRHIGTIPALLELLRGNDDDDDDDDNDNMKKDATTTTAAVDHDDDDDTGGVSRGAHARPNTSTTTTAAAAVVSRTSRAFVRENAAGALWNLSVDADNKLEILHYGGVATLLHVLRVSRAVPVLENVSGTLWNCSAAADVRAALRRGGGVAVLLDRLRDGCRAWRRVQKCSDNNKNNGDNDDDDNNSDDDGDDDGRGDAHSGMQSRRCGCTSRRVLDNVAGTLRNCVCDEAGRLALAEHGGVELLVRCITAMHAHTSRKTAATASVVRGNNTHDTTPHAMTTRGVANNSRGHRSHHHKGSSNNNGSSSSSNSSDADDDVHSRLSRHTLERLASTLLLATATPALRVRMGSSSSSKTPGAVSCVAQLLRLLTASSPSLTAAAARGVASPLSAPPTLAHRRDGDGDGDDVWTRASSAAARALAALQHAAPSSLPAVSLPVDVKERLLAVLRNCVTVADNRRVMLREGAVSCLVAAVLDGYATHALTARQHTSKRNNNGNNDNNDNSSNGSSSDVGSTRRGGLSLPLCECVAYMLWHLARDDKVTTRTQGGVQLMCLLLALLLPLPPSSATPAAPPLRSRAPHDTAIASTHTSARAREQQEQQEQQTPSSSSLHDASVAVVVEQVAGALASMMLGSVANCEVACACGGVVALARIVAEHAATAQHVEQLQVQQVQQQQRTCRADATAAANGSVVDSTTTTTTTRAPDSDTSSARPAGSTAAASAKAVAAQGCSRRARDHDAAAPAPPSSSSSSCCHAVYNALLALRNYVTTCSRASSGSGSSSGSGGGDSMMTYGVDVALARNAALLRALLCLAEHASDDWAREAALTLRSLCVSDAIVACALSHRAVARLQHRLSSSSSSSTTRTALDAALAALSRAHAGAAARTPVAVVAATTSSSAA